jgi:putative N6-adenine-specific DNA methylase
MLNTKNNPELFLTCTRGLEPLLEEELKELGCKETQQGFCGVYAVVPDTSGIYHLNYNSRIATRVLLPLTKFGCRNKEDLYRATQEIDWTRFFKRPFTFAIDANVDHPMIRNSLFAAQVVKDAICDQLVEKTGTRPSVQLKSPDLQLNLYLTHNNGVLSFDTSGDPLHKRGYRQEGGEAPLRETLAAALLKMANYSSSDVLIDPCCGSGTFLIESALMASCTAPGTFRKKWGFFLLPYFKQEEWLKVKIASDEKRIPLVKDHFFGIEINKNTQRICLSNLRATGLHASINVIQGDFNDIEPAVTPNFLIANPPYGRRLEDEESLIPLYRSLGDFMKRKLAKPSRAFVLTGSMPLSKEIGLAAKRRYVIDNGGVESRFLEFDIF